MEVACPGCHATVEAVDIDGLKSYALHLIVGSDAECQFSERPVISINSATAETASDQYKTPADS